MTFSNFMVNEHGIFKFHGVCGFETKYQDAPRLTPSMKIAMENLQLARLEVIYPGKQDYQLAENIWVRSLENVVGSNPASHVG